MFFKVSLFPLKKKKKSQKIDPEIVRYFLMQMWQKKREEKRREKVNF